MMDPATFRQLTEIRHQERLEQYTRRRRPSVEQQTTRPTIAGQVQGAWRALLARLSLAPGQ
jgi:hypothetical protein